MFLVQTEVCDMSVTLQRERGSQVSIRFARSRSYISQLQQSSEVSLHCDMSSNSTAIGQCLTTAPFHN
jgi:hypothetical protein